MSKFTPGPWRLAAIPAVVIATDPNYPDTFVGIADCRTFETSTEEAEANACLIATAPDLLAACEQAYSLIGPQYAGPSLAVSEMLAAAVAKAKGGAS